MITKQDAITANEFHENHEPAGKIYKWRRNGATQTWKTRPGDFRLPIKFGLKSYDSITPGNAHLMHRADQCPTRHVRVTMPDGAGEWFGIVTADHGNGILRVQVTTRGASRNRVGREYDVGVGTVSDL